MSVVPRLVSYERQWAVFRDKEDYLMLSVIHDGQVSFLHVVCLPRLVCCAFCMQGQCMCFVPAW